MTKDFQTLISKFPQVISNMPITFDSHEFILKLAALYQSEYISALNDYINTPTPFQNLHVQIAKQLKKSGYVRYIGDVPSANIFGNVNSNAQWKK